MLLDDPLGVVPKNITVQAHRAAGAFVLDQPILVNRAEFPDAFCASQIGGAAVGVASTIWIPARPRRSITRCSQPKSNLLLFRFAQSPRELAHAYDIDARLLHQLDIPLPGCLGVLGGASVGITPTVRDDNRRRNT